MSQAVHPTGAQEGRSSSWTDSLPPNLQPLGSSGRAYSGRLDDGSLVAVKPVPVDSPEGAGRMLDYLKRLAGYASPFLVPVRGAEYRDGAVWVMSEMGAGVPLRDLMSRWPLSASQVVTIGLDLLAALQALQQFGLSHGNLHSGNVHVTPEGRVQLSDYALRPRFRPDSPRVGWPDPRIDLVSAGLLLCSALGIKAKSEGPELSQAERSVPALVAAVRVMAEGGAGRFAGSALGLFEEASGNRARPLQLQQSRRELAELVGGGQRPAARQSVQPAIGATVPVNARRPPAARPGRSMPWLLIAGALVLLLLLAAAWGIFRPGWTPIAISRLGSSGPAAAARPASPPPSAARPAPVAPAGAAGAAAAPATPAPPESTPQPAPAEPPQPQSVQAAPAAAGSPTDAVSQFYGRVVAHDFDGAVQLWSAGMQSTYPRGEYVDGRFSNTSSMSLRRNQLISSGGGQAIVSIDLVEVRGGRTYHWVGNWYVVQSNSGWLLDRPALTQA
jgi:hypothetical protein